MMSEGDESAGELRAFARLASDNGKLIEAGWLGLCAEVLDPATPAAEMCQMRMAFFAGAQHLFVCIMNSFRDPSAATAEEGGRRIISIDKELRAFIDEFKSQYLTTGDGGWS